jgi:hypothetical protein
MTKDEALKLALEALEEHHYGVAQIIIREALAQPEQKRPQNCGTGYCSCIECVMEQAKGPSPIPLITDEEWAALNAEEK